MKKFDMNKAVEQYKDVLNQIALLEEQKDALASQIKMVMGDVEELRVGSYVVRYKNINSTRFDTTAFKGQHANLYNQFCKVSASRRFTIS